ncbi:MAG: peptidyl-prolyl cis-trans isomerase [Dorea sp.]|nr:peptidyl-prolyl cis-trans isomerase [Dorea sp.]GFI44047.1 foldase protein PrsA [Lachnospiraceae bacterium]
MKKKLLMLMLAGMLSVVSLAGCSSFKEDEVVVTVGDQKITADIANFYARYVQAQYETYYSAYLGENMWDSEATKGESYEEFVKNSVLENLEDMILLEEHMKEYEVSLSDEEKNVVEKAAKKFDNVNALEDKEKVSGSEKTVKRVMTLMAIQKKMQAKIEEGADTEVSDDEAAQKSMQYVTFSYKTEDEDGKSKDMTDEEKKEVQKKAEEFAKGAKEAKDFEAYAKEQEQEVQKGTFDSETTAPAEDLIKEADKLKEGEVTGVVKTDYGCYVAKVTSLLDREATDARKDTIVNERKQELYTNTCKEWREKAEIHLDKDVWKKIDFKSLKVTMREEVKDPYADDVETDDVADAKKEAEENAE